MYDALSVARFIVDYCNDDNNGITNLKLQKILYFVQAEFLVSKNTPCFIDPIEAWDFGPVVPVVYHKYKNCGSAFIPNNPYDTMLPYYQEIDSADSDIIVSMVDELADYSAYQLVQITHNQDPWRNAYAHGRGYPISNRDIKKYFEV